MTLVEEHGALTFECSTVTTLLISIRGYDGILVHTVVTLTSMKDPYASGITVAQAIACTDRQVRCRL